MDGQVDRHTDTQVFLDNAPVIFAGTQVYFESTEELFSRNILISFCKHFIPHFSINISDLKTISFLLPHSSYFPNQSS